VTVNETVVVWPCATSVMMGVVARMLALAVNGKVAVCPTVVLSTALLAPLLSRARVRLAEMLALPAAEVKLKPPSNVSLPPPNAAVKPELPSTCATLTMPAVPLLTALNQPAGDVKLLKLVDVGSKASVRSEDSTFRRLPAAIQI
jgi:hypothetical protein